MQAIYLIIGFVIIIKASDFLVDAAASLALKLHIPKMLIALTIVAFGTCAPEIAISFRSVATADGEMAFANIVGSCVVNVFLIIGLAAFLRSIKVKHATIKKELPLLLIITTVFSILMLDSIFNPFTDDTFSRADAIADAIILILLFFMFLIYLIQMLFKKNNEEDNGLQDIKYNPIVSIIILIIAIVLIIYSSDLIINSAQYIAKRLNISEKIITMFAIVVGTSLPEMVMTVTSAKKGEYDMAIGNIIGTNIFNICIVLGLPVLIYGNVVLTGFGIIDIIATFLSSFLLFLFARSEKTIDKKEAIVMLAIFAIYYIYLLVEI